MRRGIIFCGGRWPVAGGLDVLVCLRVRDVDHLRRLVNNRRTGRAAGTSTLIVMYDWTRGEGF